MTPVKFTTPLRLLLLSLAMTVASMPALSRPTAPAGAEEEPGATPTLTSGATPTPTSAATEPPASPTGTASPAAEPSAPPTTAAPETPAPVPTERVDIVISSGSALSGAIREDRDGDRAISAGDGTPVLALVELAFISRDAVLRNEFASQPNIEIYTEDGSFAFESIPEGVYTLWVWWSPGFIGVETWPTNPGLFFAEIRVGPDGTVTADRPVPQTFLVRPLRDGEVSHPVRSSGTVPYAGRVNVREALAARAAAGLPVAGTGPRGRAPWWPVAAGAAAFALAAAGFGLTRRRS